MLTVSQSSSFFVPARTRRRRWDVGWDVM